jgi:hypothetical protein
LQGHSGIENVFDDDYDFAFDAGVEVAGEANLAGGVSIFAVAGNGDEIERDFAGNFARQVGKEKHRAFQYADEVQWLRGEIFADLVGDLLDAMANAGAGDENANAFAGVMNGTVDGMVDGGVAGGVVFDGFLNNFFYFFHQASLLAEWKL